MYLFTVSHCVNPYESPIPKMVDLGGGLLHSGLKSSFVTFIPTNMVPMISKYFNSKCPVVNTPAAIFIPTKMATETWHFEMKCFEINDICSA